MTPRMMPRIFLVFAMATLGAACASTPAPVQVKDPAPAAGSDETEAAEPDKAIDKDANLTPWPASPEGSGPNISQLPPMTLALRDSAVYNQRDPRWSENRLGPTQNSLGAEGCLVTATAMALTNLGFQTDPADLNARLTTSKGFTDRGWLIWSGIETVTSGLATARFYDTVSDDIIDRCMMDGFYPLARFILPNGRDHWAMVVGRSQLGFHMRDPLRVSADPLIFPRGSDAFKSVRCVGMKAQPAVS